MIALGVSPRPLGGVLGALMVLGLIGCAPSGELPASPSARPSTSAGATSPSPIPSPDPTRPALAELELSADGLGPLALAAPPDVDPVTSMVAFDPEGCVDAEMGIAPGDPEAGLWRTDPSYIAATPAYGSGAAFGVGVDRDSGVVQRIDLYSSDIPTDGGVRIGDDGASVAAAHPGAVVVEQYLTDIHVVTGVSGVLQIEVAKNAPDLGDYWGPQLGTVVYIHAVVPELGVFSVAASGNLVGVCMA